MAGPDPSQPYEEPGSAFTPLPGESLTIGREPVYESGCAGTVSFARDVGARIGGCVRSVRCGGERLRSKDTIETLKRFVREHPSTLAGAGIAGFLFGRMLRGR
jgi:hypothetical protein